MNASTIAVAASHEAFLAKINATWFVIPQSGTEELADLRGEGEFGKGSNGTLVIGLNDAETEGDTSGMCSSGSYHRYTRHDDG